MNCDDAFDLLTDPARTSSAELERHLSQCPRCRQMRDVLEPALALFDDDPPHEPGFEAARPLAAPLLTAESVQLAERTAKELRRSSRHARTRWSAAAACAATLMIGLTAALSAALFGRGESKDSRPAAVPFTGTVCLWQSPEQAAESGSRSVVLSCVACHLE